MDDNERRLRNAKKQARSKDRWIESKLIRNLIFPPCNYNLVGPHQNLIATLRFIHGSKPHLFSAFQTVKKGEQRTLRHRERREFLIKLKLVHSELFPGE